jgi:hypothetical protein
MSSPIELSLKRKSRTRLSWLKAQAKAQPKAKQKAKLDRLVKRETERAAAAEKEREEKVRTAWRGLLTAALRALRPVFALKNSSVHLDRSRAGSAMRVEVAMTLVWSTRLSGTLLTL